MIFSTRHAHFRGEVLLRLVFMRQEFVQRRVEETNRRRQAFQLLEDADEIVASGRAAILASAFLRSSEVVGQDHLAHGVNAVALEEHVLGAAQADARGAERERVGRLLRRVGVGADLQFA